MLESFFKVLYRFEREGFIHFKPCIKLYCRMPYSYIFSQPILYSKLTQYNPCTSDGFIIPSDKHLFNLNRVSQDDFLKQTQ